MFEKGSTAREGKLDPYVRKEYYAFRRLSFSSVGRAAPKQGVGRWFESNRDHDQVW